MAGIKYHEAEDIRLKVKKICAVLDLDYIDLNRVFCIRSLGTSSNNIVARCHALPKILQQVLEIEPAYVVEIVSEKFDNMSEEEQIKTLIHELLHIPKTFGGGFRHHDFVQRRTIDKFYKEFKRNEKNIKFYDNLETDFIKKEKKPEIEEEIIEKEEDRDSLFDF